MFASRGIRRGGIKILDFTKEGQSSVQSTATEHTHSSVGIGAADGDRVVIVAISALGSVYNPDISSVTIGGSAATIIGGNLVIIAYRRITSGTTTDIVITSSSGSYNYTSLQAYRLIKSDMSPIDSGQVSGTAPETIANIECSPGGVVVVSAGVAGINPANPCALSWNGVDPVVTDYTPRNLHKAAHVSTLEHSTVRDITLSNVDSDTVVGTAASW